MNWRKAIGFGAALWVIMFALVSALIAFKLYPSYPILAAVLGGVVSYVLAGYAKPASNNEALSFGATWVVVGVALDWLITTRFSPAIFGMWTLWLGYGLVLLVPLLRVKK